VGPALAARPERFAPLVQAVREGAKAGQRLGLGGQRLAQILDRLADVLLQQREQQLVLAVEVLVEASQGLLGSVDDLLDGISSKAAVSSRWTRCSARERAALRLRETARCRQLEVSSPVDIRMPLP
jgi:hypothetical protein